MLEITKSLPDLFEAYGSPVEVKRIEIVGDALNQLEQVATQMPSIDWLKTDLPQPVLAGITQGVREAAPTLFDILNEARHAYYDKGVCIVSI